MNHRTPLPFLALVLVVGAAPAAAQTLTQTDLVAGQFARLQVTGAGPTDQVAFLWGFAGTGSGPCFPSAGVCLDILQPTILAILPVDATGSAAIEGFVPETVAPVPVQTQAVVLAAGGPPFPKTNPVSASFLTLGHYDDEFAGAALDPEWSVLNPSLTTLSVSNGVLELQPTVGGLQNIWYQGAEGPLVWRLVSGDFEVTTRLTVDDPQNPGAPPPISYRLAGILLQDPSSTPVDNDFCHVALGGGDGVSPLAAEDKDTIDSTSDFVLHPVATLTGELRLMRSNGVVSMWHRTDDTQPWTLLRQHARPDLPQTLRVGLMAYSAASPPRVRARFEWIRFAAAP